MRRPILILLLVAAAATIVALAVIFWPWLSTWLPQSQVLEAWLRYFVVDLNIGRWGPVATLLLVALVELVWALNLGRKSESVERQWKRFEKTHAKEIELLEQRMALMMDERTALLAELDLREDLIHEEKTRLWAQFEELQGLVEAQLGHGGESDVGEAAILRSRMLAPWQRELPSDLRGEWLRVISQLERIAMVTSVTVRASQEASRQTLQEAELLQLGRACHRLGQFERALAHYSKAIELLPGNHEVFVNRAVVNLDLGRNQAALQDLDRALKLGESAWAYLYRGLIQDHLDEGRRALENYSRALRLEPSNADAYYWRGLGHLKAREHEQAFQDLSTAVELDGGHAMAYTTRGRARLALGDSQWALSDLEEGCSLAPQLSEPYFYRGKARYELGMNQEALSDFDQALERDRDFAEAYMARGEILSALGEYKQAISDYDRAIELEPKKPIAYDARGQARAAIEEFEEAVEDHSQALELDPDRAESLANRGAAYQNLDQHEQAILDLDRALGLDPGLASAYYARALAHGSLGEYDRASRDLDRAVELDPSYAEKEHSILGENPA